MNKTIYCDMDGVLVDFFDAIIKSHGLDIEHDECHSYWLGMDENTLLAPTKSTGWWLELLAYPWAMNLIIELESIAPVVFVSVPTSDAKCPSEKVTWLQEMGFVKPGQKNHVIGLREHIRANKKTFLIDDNDHNVEEYIHAGGNAVLFPQPWNKNRHLVKTDRVAYVLEAVHEWSQTCS